MKDQLNPTTNLPPAFIEAAKEAGESLEGWVRGNHYYITRAFDTNPVDAFDLKVFDDGGITLEITGPTQLPLPAALRLANGLVRALEGENPAPPLEAVPEEGK